MAKAPTRTRQAAAPAQAQQQAEAQQSAVPALQPSTLPSESVAALSGVFSFSSFDEATRAADLVAASDFAPKDFKGKPGNVLVAWQMGVEVGLKPMQALQNIAVINGRPSLWGDAFLAVIHAHPHFIDCIEWLEDREGEGLTAVCVMKRRGREDVLRTFSEADAKQAGLYNKQGPWVQYRKRMLQMRARGFAGRDQFADALRGMTIAEEAYDSPQEREVHGETTPRTPGTPKTQQLLSQLRPTQETAQASQQQPDPEKSAEAEKAQESAEEASAAADAPFTADELIKRIEASNGNVDTINEALDLARSFEDADARKKVHAAAHKAVKGG